jgi:hypothetical protein
MSSNPVHKKKKAKIAIQKTRIGCHKQELWAPLYNIQKLVFSSLNLQAMAASNSPTSRQQGRCEH